MGSFASGSSGGACGSGQPPSGDETPMQSGGVVSEADRGAGEGRTDGTGVDEEMEEEESEGDHTGELETTRTTTGTTSTSTFLSLSDRLSPDDHVPERPGEPDSALVDGPCQQTTLTTSTSADVPGQTTSTTSTSSDVGFT